MTGQQIITCPVCGGNKTKSQSLAKFYLIMAIITAITIIGLPVAIVLLLLWFWSKKKKWVKMLCIECRHTFKVSQNKLEEYYTAVRKNENAAK